MKLKYSEKIAATYLAWWEGGVSPARLARILDVSREHASRKIMPWARQHLALTEPHGSLQLCTSTLASEELPQGLGSPRALLDILPGMAACFDGDLAASNVTRLADLTTAPCDPDIFQALYRAQATRRAVLLDYHAKSGPHPMWFSPHSLIETTHRIHFRGHVDWLSPPAEDRQAADGPSFYDIVPTRVAGIEGENADQYVSDELDHPWHERVDAVFMLSEALPHDIRSTMIQEWGPHIHERNGEILLVVRGVRRALLRYVCDQLQQRSFQGQTHEIWIPKSRI